ncbi:MAG: YfhO family protein [Oscillospiraceae bacterium]|nr:YfhO family protein [Oscillospiraceae bacterium]
MLQPAKKQWNGYLLSFAACFATAFFLFLPFIIVDKGFFLYCGDFNSQQIPFYSYCVDTIRSGGASFSWATDLGSGFVTSYSFYNLGSPIFWLACLFPGWMMPYLLAPLLCLKFGLAGLGAYGFLKRYVRHRNTALFGALLYTFSGFAVYNIFFNHFIEAVMLFPYLLWSMDDFFYDKRRGAFPLVVALNLLNNFFFFVGEALFCVIYFVCKLISKSYRIRWREFWWFAAEAVLGFLMGVALLIPTVWEIVGNPRTLKFADGMNLVMYWKVQQYFAILSSLFLPPDPPYLPNLFTEGAIKWTSLSAYLPLVSCAGVWAYLKKEKGSALSRILWVCLVMALVPVLNSAFYAFNSSYYARWYYMPLLIMALCTAIAVERYDADTLKRAVVPVGIVTGLFAVFALLPKKDGETGAYSLGVENNTPMLLYAIIITLIGLSLFMSIMRCKSRSRAIVWLCAAVMGFSVFYGAGHISLGKFPQWENDSAYKQQTYDDLSALNEALPDGEFYRIDAYGCYENMGLRLNKSCLQTFNSTVNPSIMEFYPSVGVKRDVSSKPEISNYALRGLLSVRYLLVPTNRLDDYRAETGTEDFTDYTTAGSYTILQNQAFVPMGFAYDNYILSEDYAAITKAQRSNLLMRAVVLTPEQAEQYQHMLAPLPQERRYDLTRTAYLTDCFDRRAQSCENFTARSDGFTASITLDAPKLVFFSVPYSEGFSATVNGRSVPVENVSNGMMAIPCEEGRNDIVFVYHTPGFAAGIAVSLTACGVFVIYLCWLRRYKKRGAKPA